jgi:hypothetical protein
MTFREWTGLVLIVMGLLLLPAAWAFSRVLWLLSFSMFAGGIWIFYTCRILRREARLDKLKGSQRAGAETPLAS